MDLLRDKLEIVDLSKSYDTNDVLEKVSFNVKEGEFLSILGASGCGKTTLLRILIGLLAPDSGTIRKDGVDITRLPCDRRGMGIVFQNYALFENMTVLQNVQYALRFHSVPKAEAQARAKQMIEAVGLTEHTAKYPADLSGGQQQRVAIARTLALNPDIILLDEPMSALDVATRLAMRAELKRIQATFDTTMIYVTHDQEEAFALSDRIMVMESGAIRQLDTPENIIAAPADDYVKTFVLNNLQLKINSLQRFVSGKATELP